MDDFEALVNKLVTRVVRWSWAVTLMILAILIMQIYQLVR